MTSINRLTHKLPLFKMDFFHLAFSHTFGAKLQNTQKLQGLSSKFTFFQQF